MTTHTWYEDIISSIGGNKMDIEKEKLKIPCFNCKENIIITYRTEDCPKCGMHFNPDVIHKIFHDYETRLLNNKAYQMGERLESFGNATQKAGKGMSQIGCGMTLLITIPVLIILALLLL